MAAGLFNAVPKLDGKIPMIIYPNPATEQFTINDPGSILKCLEIYDAIGRSVNKQTINEKSSNHFIDVSELHPGIYFIKLEIDQNSFIRKLIIE